MVSQPKGFVIDLGAVEAGHQKLGKRPRQRGKVRKEPAIAEARDQEIFSLRLKGYSERQIAAMVKIPKSTVHVSIERSIAERRESIERHRELQASRVARIYTALLDQVDAGDTDAARTLIAAEKRLAELHGLDAAKKHELTGAEGAPLLTLEAARALIATAKKEDA